MDPAILKTVGEIAGIGGISLGVVLILFRDVIRKNIFPMLGVSEAYKLLRLIIVLAFLIGTLGLAAWVVTKHDASKTSFTSVTNIGTIQNEFLSVTGQPLNDPELKKLIEQALEMTANGNARASIPLYQQAIQKAPLPALYTNLAAAYKQQNDDQQARAALQNALAKNASYGPALENLKRLDEAPPPETVQVSARENEPNNDFIHANEIPVGRKIAADITDASDTDYYLLKTSAGPRDYYQATVENGGVTLEPHILVYDGNRAKLRECSSSYQALAHLDCPFPAQPESNYYVEVSGESGTTGPYGLLVKPLKLYDKFEPNDDFTQAKPISFGDTIEANIMDANDTDFYLVKVSKAGQLTATVVNDGATLEPHLWVYDGNRAKLRECSSSYQALARLDCPFPAQPGSDYYVQVSSESGTSGNYKLTVR